MSGKRDWRKASLSTKRSASITDEREHRDNDAAARWLNRISKWKPADHRRQRKGGAA